MAMTSSNLKQRSASVHHQRKCHPTTVQVWWPTFILTFSNDFPVFQVGYLQRTAWAEMPSDNVAENGALPIAPTSVPGYQDMAWGSPHAQANYPVSTPYADEDERLSIVKDQPVQLLHHTAPVPITQAQVSFQCYHRDAPLVNAVTPHYNGGAQGRASDDTINPSVTLSSPDISIVLPRAVGHPLEYPQDDENVSKFGEPPLAHHATTEPTMGPTSTALFAPLSNVSWPSSVVPPLQGPYPSDYLDGGNIPTPVEWAASPAWFTRQPYLHPNQQIEIAPIPRSQSNSNAQVVKLHAPVSIPLFPNSPLLSPSEFCMHDRPSGVGGNILPIPTEPPVADYLPSGIMVDRAKAGQASGRTRAHHRVEREGSPCISEPTSTRRAGHSAKIQFRSQIKSSIVHPLADRNACTCCGWKNEDGRLCGAPVTYNNCAEHFATIHEIKNIAAKVEVLCRWCALSTEKKVIRKNILRHLREAHLHYPR
ncbi:hypothetical protein BKA82DRAFT_30542 [Pisolithus tinctorius]|uniref:Uncharacterized protein n=1 Tax=Pisolithus tinctorius Marx 270 TaxID=870435 RepID=A0A0C3NVR5_PISTI|nr:hypothetical protein BKA82DRAFT_30542 [Pisolithus tinctorius]KIN99303.1 hypothetical protein M404DRAFT_30542 [Pisolithus tinctorius Marx 270]